MWQWNHIASSVKLAFSIMYSCCYVRPLRSLVLYVVVCLSAVLPQLAVLYSLPYLSPHLIFGTLQKMYSWPRPTNLFWRGKSVSCIWKFASFPAVFKWLPGELSPCPWVSTLRSQMRLADSERQSIIQESCSHVFGVFLVLLIIRLYPLLFTGQRKANAGESSHRFRSSR